MGAAAINMLPLSQALAGLMDERQIQPLNWMENGRIRFRQDGIPKVTGNKVFAIDIRAVDMPGWPDTQSHAFILRAARADRVFDGIKMDPLEGLEPDALVTAKTLAADNVIMTESDFYGEYFLSPGAPPSYLGQPLAMLIYHDYERFRRARKRLKFNEDAIQYGAEAKPEARDPYVGVRYTRIGGATPDAPDRFSALKDSSVFASFKNGEAVWPDADANSDDAGGRAMALANDLRTRMDAPPEGQEVYRRNYRSQYVEHAALEPDNGNAWYDAAKGALHVVTGSQSPWTNADHIEKMMHRSKFDLKVLNFHPGYTVGYGQKEHHVHPYYVAMAALYADGKPVRLANDRWDHFQAALKRHPFDMEIALAVDRETGAFRALTADLRGNGGGTKNFSDSVGQVAATALQGIHYLPQSDLTVEVAATRAPSAGSMRGYGTLQSMAAFEMMVDEVANDLGIDAIELRRRNLMQSGMKNTQGAIPGGALRANELLDEAEAEPMWQDRHDRKAQWETDNPGYRYGTGFSCVHKDYGSGAEAALVQLELNREGHLHMRHVATEIGCGSTTSQMLVTEPFLGKAVDSVDFAVVDWSSLPLEATDTPYTMSQEDEDEKAENPHWVPRITSPRSASNSAYFFTHTTQEAARLLFDLSLWQAALDIWEEGIGGGQAGPLAIRRDQAEWKDGTLRASGLEPISLADLAARAHDKGLITGLTVHTFNRWAWARASFEVEGRTIDAPIDALSVKWGDGASASKKAQMTDDGYAFVPRSSVSYPPIQRNNAGVAYYAPCATMVELSVNTGTGDVQILSHKSWLECGTQIVPELVSGQLQGGIAMGIGHALYEEIPLYEDGPGNGKWNFNRYRLPRARDVAVFSQTGHVLPPLSRSDPPKGMAEVVMIPIVGAITNAVAHATGHRFTETPLSADRIKEVLG